MRFNNIVTAVAMGLGLLAGRPLLAGEPATAGTTQQHGTDLIPRSLLFGNPDRAALRVSPDGTRISFVAPLDGVLNVWVAPRDNPSVAKAITHDTRRGVHRYFWAYTSRHLLYLQDEGGNENWNVHVVDLDSGTDRNLTPNPKVAARVENVSERVPDEIIVGLNDRNPEFHDLHRINIRTGQDSLLAANPGEIHGQPVDGMITDDDYHLRFAVTMTADGGQEIFKPAGGDKGTTTQPTEWDSFAEVRMEDALTTGVEGFDKSGQVVYLRDSRDRDTAGLFALDLKTGRKTLLAEDPKADLGDLLVQPVENTVQAVTFDYQRRTWKVVDPSVQADLDYLKTVADGDFTVTSRTLDDNAWTVAYILDNGPVRFYLYDRPHKKAQFVFTNKKEWEGLPLAKMHSVVVRSRDGLNLVCYYTLPTKSKAAAGQLPRPNKPLPMVLLVHGGPWARDDWGFDPEHQWLANRGYAVLSVNYRGSTGFGKAFVNAGNKQWAARMHDDLLDAVKWAVDQKIADPKKVAIMGGRLWRVRYIGRLDLQPR